METERLLIRPIQEADFAAICQIAAVVGPGFTSLPNNSKNIHGKIIRSLESFAETSQKEARFYFFVLEAVKSKQVIGTAAIEVQASYITPLYNYRVTETIQVSTHPKRTKQHSILSLENNYATASVLCTLYVDPAHRGLGEGSFLSRSRGLFIAEFPDLFSDLIIAEMRGVFDEKGVSPFYEAIGRHFLDLDFHKANYLLATEGSQVICDLMPKYPIYIELLPKEAQEAIGKAHPRTQPALHVLQKEGFVYRGYVDVLDAGPIIDAPQNIFKTAKESRKLKVAEINAMLPKESKEMMISNTEMDFKVSLGPVIITESNELHIEKKTAEILKLDIGSWARIGLFR